MNEQNFLTTMATYFCFTGATYLVFMERFRESNLDLNNSQLANVLEPNLIDRGNPDTIFKYCLKKICKRIGEEGCEYKNSWTRGRWKEARRWLFENKYLEWSIKDTDSNSNARTNDDIDSLVNQLRERVKEDIETHCGIMKVLDMSYPIGLDHIYTNVNILESINGRRYRNITELNNSCDLENFNFFNFGQAQKTISGREAVSRHQTLLILGKPGAGKTTFLKHVAIQCSHGLFQGELVPFFITLKEFAKLEKQAKLLDYLDCSLSSSSKETNLNALEQVLNQGKALICLDGLDEVSKANSERVIKEIEKLVDNYPKNQYLMTCRIAAQEYTFRKFTEVEIADFDWKQINAFATKWFQHKLISSRTFINRLENDNSIQELASIPLLLTLLCLAFEGSGDFPENRAGLYKEGLDVLLKKWDAKRNIERDKVYEKLYIDRKQDLLSKIARDTFLVGEYFFRQDNLERYIGQYIRNLPKANTDEEALKLDSEAVLKSIESQHGLLVERAKHIYSFSHRTFQEYFTAREIIFVQHSSDEALKELVSHVFDKRWREVFLLAITMSPNAEKLLFLMKNKIDYLFKNSDVVGSFLTSLNKKSNALALALSSKREKDYLLPSIIRSFYLGVELNLGGKLAISIDRELARIFILSSQRNLDLLIEKFLGFTDKLNRKNINYFKTYNRLLGKYSFHNLIKDVQEIFQKIILHPNTDNDLKNEIIQLAQEMPGQTRLQYLFNRFVEVYFWDLKPIQWINNGEIWVEKIRQVFIKYRFIGENWQFNSEQKELLKQYYYANQLLIQCLHQDCVVSPEVRKEIEETLLLP